MVSIMNNKYSEHFGFTENEVGAALDYFHIDEDRQVIKDYYDGYLFGNTEVYNPWSIVNYIDNKTNDGYSFPIPYWVNTSGNEVVRKLIDNADSPLQNEIETLMNGGSIDVAVHEDVSYGDIDDQLTRKSSDRTEIWNFLFFTGYLKRVGPGYRKGIGTGARLMIPNLELKYVYQEKIFAWVNRNILGPSHDALSKAIIDEDTEVMQSEIHSALMQSMSYMDYNEEFYQGFVTGLLHNVDGYKIKSNRESGEGRLDIAFYSVRGDFACVMELKVAKTVAGLAAACDAALRQIEEKHYTAEMEEYGFTEVRRFGLAFCKKNCMVKKQE
jgi:hypothetical protein